MIFYFSGTGNTKWAAKYLADTTGEELIWIPDAMNEAVDNQCHYTLQSGERIGFCFPVHGWRPPFLVRNFIKKLCIEQAQGHFCYALCTAGDNIGETMRLLQQDLSSVGLRASSLYSLIMPESYVGLPFMDVDTPAKEQQKKARAKELLEQYAQSIVNRKEGEVRLDIGNWPRINTRVIGSYFLNSLVTDKPFHVVEERCIACGKCFTVCPVHNIEGGKGKFPSWKHTGDCLTCFSCYHHCPQHAIEFGNRTRKKGQYYFK